MDQDQNDGLQRNLSNRHIQLIAIGGCIGTGLFLGSGSTIQLAGPSIVFIYMLIGAVVFLVMRALGELLLSNLNYKSFVDFVSELLGPFAGFLLGWSYWLCWVVVGIADLVAIAGYTNMFFPNLPSWVPALVCILLFYTLNSLTVKLFGEMEFWFAIIKVIAVCILIIVGGTFVAVSFKAPSGEVASLSNVFNGGDLFPNGFRGFLAGFQSATFAFIGVELIGTVAAESKDPFKNLPKAINNIPLRIIMFYVLAVLVIMAVIPWHSIDPNKSPFIVLFLFAGLPAAAVIVYVVVMTSAASSTNSGIFSSSRMLYGLASLNKAPRFFTNLSKTSVPVNGLLFSCVCLLSAVVLLAIGNKSIVDTFTLVASVATIITLFTWALIVLSYIRYRKRYPERHEASKFKMPGGIFSCWVCIVFVILTVLTLTLQSNTRIGLYLGAVWFALLGASYLLIPQEVKRGWKVLLEQAINKN